MKIYAAANGAIRWTGHYQGPVSGSFTDPQDLAVSPDGSYGTTIGYGF